MIPASPSRLGCAPLWSVPRLVRAAGTVLYLMIAADSHHIDFSQGGNASGLIPRVVPFAIQTWLALRCLACTRAFPVAHLRGACLASAVFPTLHWTGAVCLVRRFAHRHFRQILAVQPFPPPPPSAYPRKQCFPREEKQAVYSTHFDFCVQ